MGTSSAASGSFSSSVTSPNVTVPPERREPEEEAARDGGKKRDRVAQTMKDDARGTRNRNKPMIIKVLAFNGNCA